MFSERHTVRLPKWFDLPVMERVNSKFKGNFTQYIKILIINDLIRYGIKFLPEQIKEIVSKN